MKKILLLMFSLLVALTGMAQDKIYKKNGDVIEAKVTEIGLNEVKYMEWGRSDGPIISLGIDVLKKVVLESGRVIEFKDPLQDPEVYAEQKKGAIKLEFLSPLFEHLMFSYEKSLRPGRSIEMDFGLIGVGFDTYDFDKSSGIHIATGYKFLRTPDFYAERYKYAHILKGTYVKPQVQLSIYKNEYQNGYFQGVQVDYEDDVVSGALVINLGKQIIYDDSFLIDYSVGIGYGFTTQDFEDDDYAYNWRENQYGFFLASPNTPLVLNFSLKIGLLVN
jgi:hypothetical protein